MKTLIVKSLLSSPPEADQREGMYPSSAKRPATSVRLSAHAEGSVESGVGRFFNNDVLLLHTLVSNENKK
jgi:hypothetical protein